MYGSARSGINGLRTPPNQPVRRLTPQRQGVGNRPKSVTSSGQPQVVEDSVSYLYIDQPDRENRHDLQ